MHGNTPEKGRGGDGVGPDNARTLNKSTTPGQATRTVVFLSPTCESRSNKSSKTVNASDILYSVNAQGC